MVISATEYANRHHTHAQPLPPRLIARCRLSYRTFAGRAAALGEDAPIAVSAKRRSTTVEAVTGP